MEAYVLMALSNSSDRRRTTLVAAKLTPQERTALRRLEACTGLSVSELIRAGILPLATLLPDENAGGAEGES